MVWAILGYSLVLNIGFNIWKRTATTRGAARRQLEVRMDETAPPPEEDRLGLFSVAFRDRSPRPVRVSQNVAVLLQTSTR